MSSSGKGKKKINRPASKKNLGQNLSSPYEGAYSNQRLVHVLLSLVGKKCQAKVRNGSIYEGQLHTFSQKMDLALNIVHKCDSESPSINGLEERKGRDFPKAEELIQEMVFQSDNLVSATFEDVDLEFAVLDVNETNGESEQERRSSAKGGEKKLEPWNGGGDTLDSDPLAAGGLENPGVDGTNGWDANEMFKANEEKYGVKSDYDSSLSSYTMPLDIQEEDPEKVARATKLAQEIEGGTDYRQRIDLELDDGVTEEEKFSAVTRERDTRRDGRGPRDMADTDGDHSGYRERDRMWGDRDRERDHPSSQGYRNNRHDHYDRYRSRGRGRDAWARGPQQGYADPMLPPSRSMGPGGPPSGGGGRNQIPMSSMDGPPPGHGGQGKYRNTQSGNIPPRFITKSGSGGYARDEERMRHQNDSAMHSSYAPKDQRQNRRPNGRRWGPTSPSTDFPHHSPTQMHSDQTAVFTGGAPTLSRTSSSSSTASMPVQNHRKHLSTSSQEEQQLPGQHHHQHIRRSQSSSSPTGGPMTSNAAQPPARQQAVPPTIPTQQQDAPPTHSWASIAKRNPKSQMGSTTVDISQAHIRQGSPSGVPPHSSGANKLQPVVNVPPNGNITLVWTPPPSTHYERSGMGGQQMPANVTGQRMVQATGHMPQMMARAPQPGAVTSPLQQQQMQPQRQQQPSMQMQPTPRMAQPTMKLAAAPIEPLKSHPEKPENAKPMPKKAPEPTTVSAKSRNDGIKELEEFRDNFKLSTEVNKDQPLSKNLQRQPQNMSQPPQRQQAYPNAAPQQQQLTYTASTALQEHGASVPRQMVPTGAQVTPATNQAMVQQRPKHVPQPHSGVHHPQQMPSQIPMASPGIQHFATQHSAAGLSPRLMDSPRAMGNRAPVVAQQKPLVSPKAEMTSYQTGNIHVVTGQPVLQANPSAVISVSAASMSPIVASQYQTASGQMSQQHQRQSPAPTQAAQLATTPSAESVPSTPLSAITSPTSAAAKALNPEAMEFKPRSTPAKSTTAIVTRATTPLQQPHGYVAAYPPQGMGGMGHQTPQLMTPMYHAGAPIDPMQAQMPQMYPQFPQQFILGQQHMVQQIPGQQMPPFATFDQSGQVYASPGPPPMMAPASRMAMPTTPQQHMSQYPSDQSPGTVYVPVPGPPTNYMPQQARPHSAHTPTHATHVTAASPASQSAQQPPQPTGHPAAPAMVPAHGAQQHMWMQPTMMVQAGQLPQQHPQQHVTQPPQIAHQYISTAVPSPSTIAMTNATTQHQKSQQQPPVQYMAQQSRSHPQYQSPGANAQ